MLNLLRTFQISFLLSHASLHVFICTNGLAYLTELVSDFYLYLFLLLFAVFVRCTVAVCWLVLSVTYSISESLKLVLLEIETHRSEGEMKKYGCLWVGSSVQSPVSCPTGVNIHILYSILISIKYIKDFIKDLSCLIGTRASSVHPFYFENTQKILFKNQFP